MSETIPTDILTTVEALLRAPMGEFEYGLARALLAERLSATERAAKIAEQISADWVNSPATTAYGQAYQRACADIAAAIRSQHRAGE